MGRAFVEEEYWLNDYSCPKRVRRTFRDSLPRIEGSILDWGCSCGYTTDDLASLFPSCRVVGMDINAELIRAARTSSPLEFIERDGYDLRGYSFDAIFAMNNVVLAAAAMDDAALGEVCGNFAAALRPGGYLALSAGAFYINLRFAERVSVHSARIVDYTGINEDSFLRIAAAYGIPERTVRARSLYTRLGRAPLDEDSIERMCSNVENLFTR